MDKYLLEILKEVKTIIIPGLGAMTITNPDTGEIMFMNYLKFDDGKLAAHISEKETIPENDAKNLISKYVREIEAKLNVGDSYDMFNFGTFFKNSDGEVDFKQTTFSEEIATNPEAAAENNLAEEKKEQLEEKIEPLVNTPIIETVIENTLTEEPATDIVPEITIEEEPVVEETPITKEEPAIIETSKAEESVKEQEYSVEDQMNDDLDVPPIQTEPKLEVPKKPILEKAKKDKKKRSPLRIVLLSLLVLVLGLIGTVGIFYNSLEKYIPFLAKEEIILDIEPSSSENDESSNESNNIKNTVTEDSINDLEKEDVPIETVEEPIVEKVPEAKAMKPTTPAQNMGNEMIQTSTGMVDRSKPYHIIGAAFSDKSNADRYYDRLKSEGNNSIIIGKFDNLYIVSIASYTTKEQANEAIGQKKSVSPNAWVFKWP